MNEVSRSEGRTVLFVSHNMAAVKSLCNVGIVLKNGQLVYQGSQLDAVNFYQSNQQVNSSFYHEGDLASAPGNNNIRITYFNVKPRNGEVVSMFSGIDFEMEFFNEQEGKNIDVTFEVENQDNVLLFHYGAVITKDNDSKRGMYSLTCGLPTKFLNAGVYSISIIFGESQRYLLLKVRDFVTFEVLPETSGSNSNTLPGLTIPELTIRSSFKSAING